MHLSEREAVKNDQAEAIDRIPVIAVLTANHEEIATELRRIAPMADIRGPGKLGDPSEIEALVCWKPAEGLLGSLSSLRLIQATGAGVDAIVADPMLDPRIPIGRTIDDAIADGMAGYVSWAVLDHFRTMQTYRADQRVRRWAQVEPQAPSQHTVGFAGAGELGLACMRAIAALGFATRCWSRTRKIGLPDGARSFAGDDELGAFLGGCNALVCLLPLTPGTTGFLNRGLFAALPEGAHLINVGRGEHLVETDLLSALDVGHLARATLDVFSSEPLPAAHPFWSRADVVITPHVAARASAREVAEQTLANLAAVRTGRSPRCAVDSRAGY